MSDAKQFNIGGGIVMVKDAAARQRLEILEADKGVPGGRILPIVDLGTSYTAELKADIQAGTFKKAVVGGRLTINGHKYLLAHPDYWYNCGDTACTKHHMLVVPEGNLASGQMHYTESGQYVAGSEANSTAGAYVGSFMKAGRDYEADGETVHADGPLEAVKAIIKADFGAANILTHREYFSNAVTDEYESTGAWYDSDIDLMNEQMVYGCKVFGNTKHGAVIPNDYTIDKSQIKLFAERPDLICIRALWWLRDVVSGVDFALVSYNGVATDGSASYPFGIRPAFGIC